MVKNIKFKKSVVKTDLTAGGKVTEVAFADGSWYRKDGTAAGGKGTYGTTFAAPKVLKPKHR